MILLYLRKRNGVNHNCATFSEVSTENLDLSYFLKRCTLLCDNSAEREKEKLKLVHVFVQ